MNTTTHAHIAARLTRHAVHTTITRNARKINDHPAITTHTMINSLTPANLGNALQVKHPQVDTRAYVSLLLADQGLTPSDLLR